MQDWRSHEPKYGNVDCELPIADECEKWLVKIPSDHNNGARRGFAGGFDVGGLKKYKEKSEWIVTHATSM